MQEKKVVRCAIYTRVSTDGQAEVEFNSCDSQEVRIRSYIASQEEMEIFKVYSDQGYSGANLNRPFLLELIRDIKAGQIDAVIAYKIDRLTRSPRDFYQLIEILDGYKVSFISVTEHFDTSTPSGRLLRNIMLTFGQFERELISERIRDKMFERAKKGMWNCGYSPFGYAREDKKLVINRDEAKVIKYIFDTYVASGSTARVYHGLKEQGICDRRGRPFSVETIAKILKGVVYIGKVTYHGTVYQGIQEPIISGDQFYLAQNLHKEKVKKSKVVNDSFFSGLVRCKECGSTMSFSYTNKKTGGRQLHYFYYKCTSIAKRDTSFCGTRQVSIDRLDRYIIESLSRIAADPLYLESLIFKLNHGRQGLLTGVEPSGQNLVYTPENAKKVIGEIVAAARNGNDLERRSLLKRHIKNITYSKEAIEVHIKYPLSPLSDKGLPAISADKTASALNAAAFFCRRPKKCRRPFPNSENPADFGGSAVRLNEMVELAGVEPASEKAATRATTSVVSII
jgi:site-specific DNA recombinase